MGWKLVNYNNKTKENTNMDGIMKTNLKQDSAVILTRK